jgi:prenyltransferase beta subunit
MARWGLVLFGFVVWLSPLAAQTPQQKQATVAYLRKLQTPSGGFVPAAGQDLPSLRATSSAARALKYFGSPLEDTKSARQFVRQCFRPQPGGFIDRPGSKTAPDVATTAIGLMAVVELKLPTAEYQDAVVRYLSEQSRDFAEIRIAAAAFEAIHVRPPKADAWLKKLEAMRNPDGTYGKGDDLARETGSVAVTVLRLGGEVANRGKVLETLRAGQRGDGGFGKGGTAKSDLESSYRIMRAFMMMKEKPKDMAALRSYIGKCRNADGGYGVEPGQTSSVSGAYYAGIILHWLDDMK